MNKARVLVLARIAVLRNIIKKEKDEEIIETTRATLDFNYEVYEMLSGRTVNDTNIESEFLELPFVRSFKTKRVFKDDGKVYHELKINDETITTTVDDDDHVAIAMAIVDARRSDYAEIPKDLKEALCLT